jgi:hypothetical protein
MRRMSRFCYVRGRIMRYRTDLSWSGYKDLSRSSRDGRRVGPGCIRADPVGRQKRLVLQHLTEEPLGGHPLWVLPSCLVAECSWDQVRWALEERAWRFERLGVPDSARRR